MYYLYILKIIISKSHLEGKYCTNKKKRQNNEITELSLTKVFNI